MSPRHQPDGPPQYFVCYSRVQRDLTTKIQAKLAARERRQELELWRDVRNLEVWEQFTPEIRAELDRAAGAIVVVSDDWYASDYIHEHEWPRIQDRADSDPTFAVFPLAYHALDSDDPLRRRNLVNDLTEELLVAADDATRDAVLTRLSDKVGEHARTLTSDPTPENVPATDEPVTVSIRAHPVTHTISDRTRPVELRPGLHGVPELPTGFVEPAELDVIAERLLDHGATGISGLRGEGGTGKSVLAAAVARRLEAEFPTGVHWAVVGENATPEDVRQDQIALLASLGVTTDRPPRDFNEGREQLAAALAERAALLIVDDIWEPWHGRAFDVVAPDGPARVLFTTRFSQALPAAARAATTEVTRLDARSATAFLRRLPAALPRVAEDQAEVLEAAGGLRLALAVLSATAHVEGGWDAVLPRLAGLAERFGSGDEASAAHKAAFVALETLDENDRLRAWTLASFPADEPIPTRLLGELWNLEPVQAADVVERFEMRQLVDDRGDDIDVHDHVHDYLVLAAPPMDVHQRLWAMARERHVADGEDLAGTDRYLWERLVWHACRAELRTEQLTALVSDVGWLATRIRRDGSSAAEQDMLEACRTAGLRFDAPLRQMQRVLRHGALFDSGGGDDESLELSLDLWKRVVTPDDSSPWSSPPAPRPGRDRPPLRLLAGSSLPVPSDALLRTLRGHTAGVWGVAFHPTTGHLATASSDGTARLWDPTTGETLQTFQGHTAEVWGVAFHPTTGHLATASYDGTARLWDPTTGRCLLTLALACSGRVAWAGDRLALTAGRHWVMLDTSGLAAWLATRNS